MVTAVIVEWVVLINSYKIVTNNTKDYYFAPVMVIILSYQLPGYIIAIWYFFYIALFMFILSSNLMMNKSVGNSIICQVAFASFSNLISITRENCDVFYTVNRDVLFSLRQYKVWIY